ncbi:MAG: prephenate dehydrogenase [Clostridia bacterium]|nr:prephenate dehydrogenase [Clostridia bacterium]
MLEKVTVIGLGVIGGSMGMAIKAEGLAREVAGHDCQERALAAAVQAGAIDRAEPVLAEAVKGADLVILAVPVGEMAPLAKEIKPSLKEGALVTDTGSTKGRLVRELEDIFAGRAHYVGGHPMAGSERPGLAGADRYLLENAVYVLTPTPKTDAGALGLLQKLLEKIGARVLILDPDEHDLLVAAVSHLPFLLAVALLRSTGNLAASHPHAFTLAAGGFRDITRIAAGNARMWRDICLTNCDAILKVLDSLRAEIAGLEEILRRGAGEEIEEVFRRAAQVRSQVPARQKGILPPLHEIVLTVPDKPGVIGHFAGILGEAGINIMDIEILKVREGEGGSIRLGFTTAEAAARALEILRRSGIKARER